jgi:hypothetical protein
MSVEENKRNFTVAGSDIGFEGGVYKTNKSGTPLSAARKAAAVIFRMIENKNKNPKFNKYHSFAHHKGIKFIIRETTRGSAKESYYYEAVAHPLKTPKVIKRGDEEIVVTKTIEVKAHLPSAHGSVRRG